MKLTGILLMLATLALVSVSASSEVPHVINYQGRLTDSTGQPVADDTYSIQFTIYADSGISIVPALWTETQNVSTTTGLFSVLLGSANPIDPSVFDGSIRYLGITVGANPESTPRVAIASVPYAMVAGSGSGTVDCEDCDDVFINAIGPDVLTATGDTALTITNSGPNAHLGLQARVETSSNQPAAAIRGITNSTSADASSFGAAFDAVSTGTGTAKGVQAIGENNSPTYGAFGIQAIGRNNGVAEAAGGWFEASSNGSGPHYGVYGTAFGASGSECIALRGFGQNSGIGRSYGGHFTGYGAGGAAYGAYTYAHANSDSVAVGVYGNSDQHGHGKSIGGWFTNAIAGTGQHIGVLAESYADDDVASTYGVHGTAANNGYGKAYGGYFVASDSGQGYHYGIKGSANSTYNHAFGSSGTANCYGSFMALGAHGSATSHGSGSSNAGYFEAWSLGTGSVRGVYAYGFGGANAESSYGIEATGAADLNCHGPVYGGYLTAAGASTSAGNQYGAYAQAETYSTNGCFGVYGRGTHHGTGNVYGGYFITDSSGTGVSYGIRPVGLSKGSKSAYGTASVAANRGTGVVYGGYFEMLNYGTGGGYGIYAKARTTGAPASWAGYFEGHVRITNVLDVLGTKSAAVKVDNGEYRRLYCQESPEIWFEDFGEGQLTGGRAHIELDAMFLQTVTIDAANPMKVFIQLNDPDCNGAAVVRGSTGFDVVELLKGTSNASFSYRVIAKRRGYENERLELMPGPTPEEVSARAELDRQALVADENATELDHLNRLSEKPLVRPEGPDEHSE